MTTDHPVRRPGGRTARTRAMVLDAARRILVEQGADGLTWDALAARSGVNRSTVYRRWSTLGGVVADLASQFADDLDYPVSDALAEDMHHVVSQVARTLTPETCRLVQSLVGWRDPGVQEALGAFWAGRRSAVGALLAHHGVASDPALVVRMIGGPLYYSALVEDRCPTQADADATTTAVLAWLATQDGDPR